MTPQELKNIMDFIKNDPEAIKRTNSYLSEILPDSLGWAGWIRNVRYFAPEFWMDLNVEGYKKLGLGDKDFVKTMDEYNKNLSEENYKFICGGIAEATAKVINDEIRAGNPLFKNLKDVRPDHRVLNDFYHTATKFTDKEGKTFVLDYHATLNIDNPKVYPSFEDWEKGINGRTAEEYFKEHSTSDNRFKVSPNESLNLNLGFNEILDEIRENVQKLKNNINRA
jgi:hypothetical protein